MGRKVLTGAATMEIKRLYSLKDANGRPQYSQMQIAEMLGVGETTVFRVIHKVGIYAQVRELPTDAEAEASLEKFKKMNPHLFAEEGDAALTKLQAAVQQVKEKGEAGDKMLAELGNDDFMKGCGV